VHNSLTELCWVFSQQQSKATWGPWC